MRRLLDSCGNPSGASGKATRSIQHGSSNRGEPCTPSGGEAMAPRVVFVTGKLAEPALRRVVGQIANSAGIEPQIVVLPISVAALLTTDWIASHLQVPPDVARIIVPGLCSGELAALDQLGPLV